MPGGPRQQLPPHGARVDAERDRGDAQRRLDVALRSGHMGTYSWDPESGAGVYDEPLLELYGFHAVSSGARWAS